MDIFFYKNVFITKQLKRCFILKVIYMHSLIKHSLINIGTKHEIFECIRISWVVGYSQ